MKSKPHIRQCYLEYRTYAESFDAIKGFVADQTTVDIEKALPHNYILVHIELWAF